MFDDSLFHELHVQESDGSFPQVVTWQLFEIWRRDALLAASCSTTTKRLERMDTKEKMEVAGGGERERERERGREGEIRD